MVRSNCMNHQPVRVECITASIGTKKRKIEFWPPDMYTRISSCLLGRRLSAATSSCHERLGNRPVFSHPIPGVRRQWPVVRFFFAQWNCYLCSRPWWAFLSAGVVIQDSFAVLSCFHPRECMSSLHCRSTPADHYYGVTTVGLLLD